jgi:hypothetical protein
MPDADSAADRFDDVKISFAERLRRASRTSAFWAVLAFAATRFGLYVCFSASTSDVGVYFHYVVQGVDYGRTPYLQSQPKPVWLRDIRTFEYPPVAFWVMALPRKLSNWRMLPEPTDPNLWQSYIDHWFQHYTHYDHGFRGLMLLADITAFWLFAAILRRRKPEFLAWGLWAYVLSTAVLGYVLLERLDIFLTFLLLAWAYCWLRADDSPSLGWLWSATAYAALGLGISFKLIPIIIVPFPLLADLHGLWRRPRDARLLLGPVALAITALGPFAYYYTLVGSDLKTMFEFHSVRGVQIESSYASAMMLSAPAEALECYFGYGSWNLRGAHEATYLKMSSWLLPAVLLGFGLRALAAPLLGEKFDRTAAYRWASVTVPVATLLAKVFSVQYLLWATPFLLLAGAEYFPRRGFRAIAVGSVLSCALTAFVFPHHYMDKMYAWPYSEENPPPFTLIENFRDEDPTNVGLRLVGDLSEGLPRAAMVGRNVLLAALCAAITVAAMRRQRE